MGTLFEALSGEEMQWKRGVMQDDLAVKTCRILGQNILRLLKE
jgi:hypothetical protein